MENELQSMPLPNYMKKSWKLNIMVCTFKILKSLLFKAANDIPEAICEGFLTLDHQMFEDEEIKKDMSGKCTTIAKLIKQINYRQHGSYYPN